jgi:hypothetical protein
VYLDKMKIYLRELVVVRNREGLLNLNTLQPAQSPPPPESKTAKAGEKAWTFRIDRLELKIDKVLYKDYSSGGEPSVREFPVNIEESFEDISRPEALVRIIVVKALLGTTLGQLPDFDVNAFGESVAGTLASSQKIAFDVATQAGQRFQETTAQAVAAAGENAEALMRESQRELGEAARIPGAVTQKAADTTRKTLHSLTEKAKGLTGGFKLPLGQSEEESSTP